MTNTIKIYYVDLNKLSNEIFNDLPYLLEEDYINANKYKMEEDKKQHLISAYFKRKYMPDYILNSYGKPISNNTFVNISHSYNMVVVGISSNNEIGIDIEKIRDASDSLKKYISSEEELNYIKDDKTFYEIWTSKEAITKCYGSGLNNKIKDIPALPLNGTKEYMNKLFFEIAK